MCVIVYKPMGKKMANIETLKACWETNPHGTGIMVARNNEVIISKGYMTWEDFLAGFTRLEIKKEEAAVIHFRIASHGKVSKANCHPFPISASNTALTATNLSCPVGLAHNGIIDITPEGTMSDTMTFIKEILSEKSVFENRNSPTMRRLINNFVGSSKIIMLFASGKVNFFGVRKANWKTIGECLFSNDYFKSRRVARAGSIGDDDDMDGSIDESNFNFDEGESTKREVVGKFAGRTVYRKGQGPLESSDHVQRKTVKVNQLNYVCPKCGLAAMTKISGTKGECQWCGIVDMTEGIL